MPRVINLAATRRSPLVLDPHKQRRQCIRCHRAFDSEGIANRVCPRCKNLPVVEDRRSASHYETDYGD